MKVFIAGGTGFLGTALIAKLLGSGHRVTALARSPEKLRLFLPDIEIINGSPMQSGPWQQEIARHDALLNLTGTNIFTRWTEAAKERILQSRVQSTRNIVEAIPDRPSQPMTLISASASGYYGFCGDEEKREQDLPGNDFLARVCRAWEQEANRAQDKARVITPRIGIVLGRNGGALAKMLPGFRLGVAGKLGHGRQWFPWIHLDDLTDAILYCMETNTVQGPVNMSAPKPARNLEFTRTLGRVLHRPTFMAVPSLMVRLALGELSAVVLEGCKMVPGVLQEEGFSFRFPNLEDALRNLLEKATDSD